MTIQQIIDTILGAAGSVPGISAYVAPVALVVKGAEALLNAATQAGELSAAEEAALRSKVDSAWDDVSAKVLPPTYPTQKFS